MKQVLWSFMWQVAFNVCLLDHLNLVESCEIPFNNCTKNILKGKHLKIATVDLRPYVIIDHDPDGTMRVSGFVYQMIKWLAEKYDFKFTLLEPSDGLIGTYENGSWSGLVKMLTNDEVDLLAAPITPSIARNKVLDFTTTFTEDHAACLIPAPEELDKMTAIFKPFQYQTWILITISVFVMSVVIWATMRWTLKQKKPATNSSQQNEQTFSQNLLSLLGVITNQHQSISDRVPHSTRIALASWCLASVILIALYNDNVISFVAVPKLKPFVSSVEDLAYNSKLEVAVAKGSIFETILLERTYGPLKVIGDSLRQNPNNRLVNKQNQSGVDKILETALDGRFAIIASRPQLEQAIAMDYERSGNCRLDLMPQSFLTPLRSSLALPKGSPYTDLLNEGIMIMRELGLLKFWKHRYMVKANLQVSRCSSIIHSKETEPEKQLERKPLKLLYLSGAFILLLVGFVISTLSFAFEKIMFNFSSKRQVGISLHANSITAKPTQVEPPSQTQVVLQNVNKS